MARRDLVILEGAADSRNGVGWRGQRDMPSPAGWRRPTYLEPLETPRPRL